MRQHFFNFISNIFVSTMTIFLTGGDFCFQRGWFGAGGDGGALRGFRRVPAGDQRGGGQPGGGSRESNLDLAAPRLPAWNAGRRGERPRRLSHARPVLPRQESARAHLARPPRHGRPRTHHLHLHHPLHQVRQRQHLALLRLRIPHRRPSSGKLIFLLNIEERRLCLQFEN